MTFKTNGRKANGIENATGRKTDGQHKSARIMRYSYLSWLKQGLRLKHEHLLGQLKAEPLFYLEALPPEKE